MGTQQSSPYTDTAIQNSFVNKQEVIKETLEHKEYNYKYLMELKQVNPQTFEKAYQMCVDLEYKFASDRAEKDYLCFKLHYFKQKDEQIVVTGSTDFLGNWDPLAGIYLEYKGEGWWEKMQHVQCPPEFELKYVSITEDGYRWETGFNRVFPKDFNRKLYGNIRYYVMFLPWRDQ